MQTGKFFVLSHLGKKWQNSVQLESQNDLITEFTAYNRKLGVT